MLSGWGSSLIQFAGAGVVVALFVQALVLVVGSIRRARVDADRRGADRDLLRLRVETVRARQAARPAGGSPWEGFRKFEVRQKVRECDGVVSFDLAPHDRKPLLPFRPGQFLTFRLAIPGQGKPVIRCYSLSDSPDRESYRVSIKKVAPPRDLPDAPPGLASSFFHDRVEAGDILDVRAPAGKFCLDPTGSTAVVLIAGGIGITPLLSMLNAIVACGARRETWLFLGVRNQSEHPWKEPLERLARRHERFRLQVCYSNPGADDRPGRDFHHARRVGVDLLRQALPSNNYEFFLCGPPPMMAALRSDLKEWGVPGERVHSEAFGAATIRKLVPAAAAKGAGFEIDFARSGKKVAWNPGAGSLLDLALANGVVIDSGCRAGNCNTCLTAIKAGEVRYVGTPGAKPEAGSCLTCIAVPAGNLTLDA